MTDPARTDAAVRTRIREFLAGFLAHHDLADDEDIFASGHVNSLFVLQLVLMVESVLAATVEDEDLEIANFATVDAIVGFVGRKRAALAGA